MWLFIGILAVGYLIATLALTYVVLQVPRQPVHDPPDWGVVMDTRIPTRDGGELEVWRIDPHGASRGVVVLAHGWGRNRDRMVRRAKVFGRMGFTTVIHSARDHGRSTPHHFMNAVRFAEDIEAVLTWIGEPVLLYGHSIGAAASVIAAGRKPGSVRLLFLEACYARTKEALRSLYRNYNLPFGILFGAAIVLVMDICYRFRMDQVSPVRLAPLVDIPVLIIHGEKDQNFPIHHAWRLRDSFPAGRAHLFVARGADHSSCSQTPEFPGAIRAFIERYAARP